MWQTERGKVSSGCGLWPWVSESRLRSSCASTSPVQPGGQPGSHLQTERALQPWAAAHLPRQLRTFSTGDHTVTHRGRGDPGRRGRGGGGGGPPDLSLSRCSVLGISRRPTGCTCPVTPLPGAGTSGRNTGSPCPGSGSSLRDRLSSCRSWSCLLPPTGGRKRDYKGRGFSVLTLCASPIKMPSIFSDACYFFMLEVSKSKCTL